MKKVISIFFLLIGLILVAYGSYEGAPTVIKTLSLSEYKTNSEFSKNVIVKGKLEKTANAIDDEFGIEVESPILIREVEMVQWFKDEKGIRLVLANYPLDSFKDGGKEYKNPSFYKEVLSKDFISSATLKDFKVDKSILEAVANSLKSSKIKKATVTELPNDVNKEYELIIRNGDYVSVGDSWKLGDVKISYYYPDSDDISITVISDIKNKTISCKDINDIYLGKASMDIIKENQLNRSYPYLIITGVGLLISTISIVVLAKSKKKKK